MNKQELIENEAEKYAEDNYGGGALKTFAEVDYKAGINSQLNKDLTELAVIDGTYKLFKECFTNKGSAIHVMSSMREKMQLLETQRTELTKKLNIDL